MAAPCQPCGVGRSQCHLRRIGGRASVSDIPDVIHFWKTVTLIGRKRGVVDYFLSDATPRGSDYISRIHARVIQASTYELVDSSLTGVYVNDVRIHGRTVLQEGDTVTFGHPAVQNVALGVRVRQPNSPFYFLFERCHCSLDQMPQLPGEFPVLASAETCPEIRLGLGSEMKAALMQRARAAPEFPPARPALSELNGHHRCCRPAAFCTLPPSLAASVQPPVTSSPTINFSSNLLKMPGDPGPGAAPECSVRSRSQIRRSLSPEYAVLEEEMPGATKPFPQGALDTKCGPFIQESPKLTCSDPAGGNEELPAGGRPGSRRLFPRESCTRETGTGPLQVVRHDPLPSSRPASACPDESVAADLSSSPCGPHVSSAELPRDGQELTSSFQVEEGDGPKAGLSPPGAKELVSSGSDHNQEVMEMEVDERTEEAARSDTTCLSEAGSQEQVPEVMEEAVRGDPVTSAGCSGDRGLGEEGTVEGHGQILTEKPFHEAGLQETEWAGDGNVTDISLPEKAPETLDWLSDHQGSRALDDLLCGQEPDGVLPASLRVAKEVDPEALSAAVPSKNQGDGEACEGQSQGNVSEDEGDVEMLSHGGTGLLATGCPLGPREMGSADPEGESDVADHASLGELSFAEVGTQTGGLEEREMSPVMTEAREERGASHNLAIPQHYDNGINTPVAKETLLQQFSEASASDSPACEVSSRREFSGEGAITAAASSGMTQEKSPSEGLLETCQEDPAQVAAAPPSGLGWGKEIVLQAPLEADLQEQLMDLDGEHFEACPSQRSETCPGGGPEGAAAERELECGSTRGAEPDAAAGSRLAACELGHEEEKHDGEDGVAPAPACASLVEPDSLGGHESECQEEMDCDGAAGGGESKAQRGRSVASASPAGTAVGEDGCEKQPERRLGQPSSALQVSCGGADGGPARSPEGGVASSLAGGPPRLLPPSQLGIPPLCAGTPLLFQKSDNGSGGRLQSESSRLLPKQDDTEDEPEANQNNEIQATAQSCSVDAKPIEDAQHRERAELEQNDSQMERWTDCHESHGMPSGPSAQFECQVGPSLPRDCQEPEFRTGELLGLGNNPEVEPQGADAGKGLFSPDDLPVEGSAWEKVGQADVAVECSALSSPKGGREEVVVPEQGSALDPSPQGSSCGEEKGLCLAGSKQSQALQASPDSQVPRQSRADSGAVPESSSSEELDLCKSDSEAEKQENDNSQAHSTCGGEAVIPKERDAFISDSAEHLGGVTENGEAGGKRTEWWATQDQGTAASEETGDGPPKATDTLAQQNSSCGEPCRDLSGAAVAVPQTSVTDVAAGGTSPALVEAAAGGEELEDQAAEGTESLPLNLSCVSEEDSHLLERDAKLGIEDQSPGGASGVAKENGPNLLEESRCLDSRFAGQLGREMLDVGETPEEHVPSEIPAGVCAEEAECAPKTKEIEKMSQSEDRPGCSDWLKRPDWGRSSSPKEEKSEGCSSRKRRSSEDQALGILDGEHDFYGQKRLRPLNSGSDLHASPAPLDLERQFSRTIGKFLQQYSSQITLPSEEAEKKGRDRIAQIVRTYFNGPFGPEELEAENLEVEMSSLPLEAQTTEGADCESAARSEAERGAAGAETESTLTLNAEPQVNPVQHQDPSLPSECSSSSAPAPSSGSHAQQPGQELAPHIPESAWKAYFSEEEEFQSSISSVMEHPLLNSPVASPKAPCGQEPSGKNMDLVFSDISNSSAESEHGEPPPELEHGSSTGMGSGQLQGAPSGAGEAGLALGGASSSPEPAGEGWCKEESSTPCGMGMSSHESILLPEADWPVESEDQYDTTGEKTDAPVLQQAGSTFDGEGGHKAPGAEAPEQAIPPTVGETREELDDSTSRMQIEDGAFLQRNDEDAPSQELDCKPANHQPSDSTLWGRHTPCVKVEPAPHHLRELFDEEGNASPSRTASVMVPSEPVGCPTVVDTQGKDSMLQSSSLARVTPSLGQARVCGQARNSSLLNRSCLLRSMKKDGCAKTADVRRKLQSREDGSSLCPLLPSGPAGAADDLREIDFGDGLESDPGRSGAGWAGQMEARSAAQGDVGDVGRRAAPLLTAAGCGNQRPVCSPMLQEDAPVLTRLLSLPSVSCTIKEEPEPCDSHVQVAGFSPHEAYPTSCSPVIPVLQKPRIAEASENWVPESPVGCHEEEAEAPGQLDTACMLSDNERSPCAEAKEGHSSTSMGSPAASDPPPQGAPRSYEEHSSVLHTSTSNAGGAESSPGKPWASSEQEVAFQLQECHSVLEEISRSLGAVEGIDDLHMEKWREQIAELQKATKMPRTSIAVVGNTGAGKSSLLNALLDEEAVLPTSAMRACTAVVVEISGAAGGSRYQAEVEFFSKEEWYKELKALLEDMKDKSGNLKRRCPDRKTEAGVAYSRVKAVYGRVDEVAKLESLQDVTQYLGTVKRISAETAAEFRANIEKFIDSRTDNLRDMKGGEFWPIVKCVKICVAQAEVLKTGVVLVDLPGIRDSNAARDNAAKEYLKNCNAVWVVASITRAVDDKTAKEILNSNLRRQLFMDGQYGNLAFICTKTDSFNISDIVRDLDLRREIQPLEEELEELESQRIQVEEEKGALHMALQLEHQQGAEAADPAWMQRQHHFLEKEFQLSTLQKQKDAKLRAISQICVQARNRFSKQRIWMDFNTGLEELKRKAELSECDDDDGDEDMEDRDFPRSDPGDLGEADSPSEKLHVFTVSSTEYLKLNGQMRRDGPAQVFHDPRDTEIPALKSFAIETGLKTSIKATEKVIRDVARVISEIVHYLTNQRAEDISHHAQAQEIVQRALQGVPRLLQEAADDVLPDIQYFFGVLIQTRLSRGSIRAKELCEDVVKSWGLPDFGFPHATYHAACLRQGVYTSPKYRCVDFNSHLAEPVQNAIAVIWSEVFNSKLEESLQRFTKAVLDKLKFFFRELKRNVGQQSSLTEALEALYLQQMEAVQAQLHNFLLDQEDSISRRQRTISRMLTPAIQAGMEPAYTACSQMSGPGYFQRMKAFMESYVHQHKNSIFDAATKMLQEQLHQLQQQIRQSFQSLLLELKNSLRMQFEPLLKPVQKNAEMIPDLLNICAKVAKICKRSCVEYVLPSATQVEASSPEVGKELRGNSLCFSALRMDIRLGTVPLPGIAAIQVSGQDLALRLTDGRAVALPLRRISLCESCLPLGCLILHVSSESAGEICRRCGVQVPSPGQFGQEALVILDQAQDRKVFSRLTASVSSSHSDALRVRTLSLCQGRERLESLGVDLTPRQSSYDVEPLSEVPAAVSLPPCLPQAVSVVQQPQLPPVNLVPYGKKRAKEDGPALLKKRHKSQAGPEHAGRPLPNWSREGKMASSGQRAASCPPPASGVSFPADGRQKAGWFPEAAPHSKLTGELTARPGSAGVAVRAEEGLWGKCYEPDSKGDSDKSLKTRPVESGKEASPAGSSWLIR